MRIDKLILREVPQQRNSKSREKDAKIVSPSVCGNCNGTSGTTEISEAARDALAILKLAKRNGRVSLLGLGLAGVTIPRVLAARRILERGGIQVYRNASHLWLQHPRQHRPRRVAFDNKPLAQVSRKAAAA